MYNQARLRKRPACHRALGRRLHTADTTSPDLGAAALSRAESKTTEAEDQQRAAASRVPVFEHSDGGRSQDLIGKPGPLPNGRVPSGGSLAGERDGRRAEVR
jgi:hypothetical protein